MVESFVMVRSVDNPARLIIELPGREPFVIEDYREAYAFVMQACYAIKAFDKERGVDRQPKS